MKRSKICSPLQLVAPCAVLVLLTQCTDGQTPSMDAGDGRGAVNVDGNGASDIGAANDATTDSAVVDAIVGDTGDVCDGGCGPGSVCTRNGCLADCRMAGANPCGAMTTCDMLTGQCLDPSQACTVPGDTTRCGGMEFPSLCGPGSRCDMPSGRCVVGPDCMRVVCDAAGNCRGVDCAAAGMNTPVMGLRIAPPVVGMRGAVGGLQLQAQVTAMRLCGLNVSFEVRKDEAFYVSAGNDQAIWKITLGGMRSAYLGMLGDVSGLAADRDGKLYYMLTRTGDVMRVDDPGGGMPRVSTRYAQTGAPAAGRGVSRITFGPDGLLYAANRTRVQRVERDGSVTLVTTIPGILQDTLTGLAFDASGALLFSEIFPRVFRLAPGAAMATQAYTVNSITPLSGQVQDFFSEALALGPDGLIYGSSFPSNPVSGQIYQVNVDNVPHTIVNLAAIRPSVASTRYAGIHGMAFGVCNDLYFVNQNTSGNTREPLGQLLVRRASDNSIALVNEGFNLNWPDGFDGDLVIGQRVLSRGTARVGGDGVVRLALDVPMEPGCYQARALITDPVTGAIRESRIPFTVN